MNFLRDLYMDGSFDYRVRGFTEFGNGKAAMVAERPQNLIGDHDYYASMKDNIGVVPFPKMDKNSKAYAPALMTANFVPNKARNPAGRRGMDLLQPPPRHRRRGQRQRLRAGTAPPAAYRTNIRKFLTTTSSPPSRSPPSWKASPAGATSCAGSFGAEILTESPSNSKPAEEAIAGMENIIKTHLKLTVGG